MTEENYKLRQEDFVPFIGLTNYENRNSEKNLDKKCMTRRAGLITYNSILGASGIVYGLVKLLG